VATAGSPTAPPDVSAHATFLDAVAARIAALATEAPALADVRATARLDALPTGKLEAFKYTPVESLYDPTLTQPRPVDPAAPPPLALDAMTSISTTTAPAALPHGVTVVPLAEAVGHGSLNAGLDVDRYPLIHLNTGLLSSGVVIRVARGVAVAVPLALDLTSPHSAACTRVVLDVEDGARVELIEQHHQPLVASRVLEIRVGTGAQLSHLRWQAPSDHAAWQLTSVALATDARYRLHTYAAGGAPHRNDYHVRLEGTGADFELTGVALAAARDRLDQHVVVEHRATDGRSRQSLHGIARDHGRLSFNGRIHIHPGAARTDAKLTNRNLQLDPGAQVNTKPELEIYADDVQCAHGATVGQLDAAALFYLQSRGIDALAARAMLMRGFIRDCIPDTPWAEQVGVLLDAALGDGAGGPA
jgi:Fe-S cluster assembly protein SufD